MKEGIDQKGKIKEDTVALFAQHDPSGENVENYSRFFEKCINGIIAYFERKLIQFKENGLDDEAARLALFEALSAKEIVQNMVSNVSPLPAYLVSETSLSNYIMELILSTILQTEEVMLAIKHDAKANDKIETHRCLIAAPCELSYVDGEKEHVVFVALSGHASDNEEDPLRHLHQKLKEVVDNLHYTHADHGVFHFRYIEASSRSYDVLLQQMNEILSKNDIGNALENKEEKITLSNAASKGCAEKKIFSEIAKHLMEVDRKHVQKMFLAGMTNVCLPGLHYLETPGTIEELQFRAKEAAQSKKYKKEYAALKECNDVLDNTIANIEQCKADLLIAPSKSKAKTLERKLNRLNEQLNSLIQKKELLEKELDAAIAKATLAEDAETISTDNVIYISTKEDSSRHWPCWKIPACSQCQEHKSSYLGILYQSSQHYMPVYAQSTQSPVKSGPSNSPMMQSPVKSGPSNASGPSTPISMRTSGSFLTPSTPLASSFHASPMKISPAQVTIPKRKTEGAPEGESSKRRKISLNFS